MRKALADPNVLPMTEAGGIWYILLCLYFGAGYLNKVVFKKALSEATSLPVR